MRISDWSSDVCSSDLREAHTQQHRGNGARDVELEFLADDLGNHGFHGLGDLHVTLAAAGPGRHLEQLAHTRIACLVLRVAITGNGLLARAQVRSEEHTSELPSLMRLSYAVFCL